MYTGSRKRGGDILKKYTKFILVTLLIIILNFVVLLNTVQAVENGTINIYTKGYFKRVIKNNGIVLSRGIHLVSNFSIDNLKFSRLSAAILSILFFK